MPELPDIEAYAAALSDRVLGRRLERIRLANPFLLRSVEPPLSDVEGRVVGSVSRLGKRIVIGLESELALVIHLMIAGRFHWRPPSARAKGARGLCAEIVFDSGTLTLTEAGTKKRASLHVVRGRGALDAFDRGGLELPGSTLDEFRARLALENHTLKRALTDPRLFAGVGNAYSDEILHRAKLSPVLLSSRLSDEDSGRLHAAALSVLSDWTSRLVAEARAAFPERVTAFREDFAVHGKFGKPCPDCGSAVQRIRYADNEANYCATCQTGGKLLADRALSRLLGRDWPKTLDEMEEWKNERSIRGAPAP